MIFSIIIIQLLALASPGPDFFYILSSSLNKNKTTQAVLGTTLGCMIWSSISAIGISALIFKYQFLIGFLTLFGVCYLIYLSIMIYKSRNMPVGSGKTFLSGFYGGFLVNITNPKAIFYYSSIFSIFLANAHYSFIFIVLIIIWIEIFLWFFMISKIFSNDKVIILYNKYKAKIDIAVAILIAIIAISLLFFYLYKFNYLKLGF